MKTILNLPVTNPPKNYGHYKESQTLTYLNAKEKSSFQFYNKISVYLLPTCLMFCSGRSNSLVCNVHEKALRIVYDNHKSSCSELLMTKNELTIHQQNINVLKKEIYKFEKNLSPLLIDDMFQVIT